MAALAAPSRAGWTAAFGGSLLLHAGLAAAVLPLLDGTRGKPPPTEISFSEPPPDVIAALPQRSETLAPSPRTSETLPAADAATAEPAGSAGQALAPLRNEAAAEGLTPAEPLTPEAAARVDQVAGEVFAALSPSEQGTPVATEALPQASAEQRVAPSLAGEAQALALSVPAQPVPQSGELAASAPAPAASVANPTTAQPLAAAALEPQAGAATATPVEAAELPGEAAMAAPATPAIVPQALDAIAPAASVPDSAVPAAMPVAAAAIEPPGSAASVVSELAPVLTPSMQASAPASPSTADEPLRAAGLAPALAASVMPQAAVAAAPIPPSGAAASAVPESAPVLAPSAQAAALPPQPGAAEPVEAAQLPASQASAAPVLPQAAVAAPLASQPALSVTLPLRLTQPLASEPAIPPAASSQEAAGNVLAPLPLAPLGGTSGAIAPSAPSAGAVLEPIAQQPETVASAAGAAGGAAESGESTEGQAALRKRAVAFARNFKGGGNCFAVVPAAQEGDAVGFDAFSRNSDAMRGFAEAALALGKNTSTSFGDLSAPQCRALLFARNLRNYPDFSVLLRLEQDRIPDHGFLAGRIGGARGKAVHLLLIDDEGTVQTLQRFTASADEPTFRVQMNLTAGVVQTKQLLMAITADDAVKMLDNPVDTTAPAFFSRLEAELRVSGTKLDLALGAFNVDALAAGAVQAAGERKR